MVLDDRGDLSDAPITQAGAQVIPCRPPGRPPGRPAGAGGGDGKDDGLDRGAPDEQLGVDAVQPSVGPAGVAMGGHCLHAAWQPQGPRRPCIDAQHSAWGNTDG